MSSYHVHVCDACGAEIKTHNDDECQRLPSGWTLGPKGAYCTDCAMAHRALTAAFGE